MNAKNSYKRRPCMSNRTRPAFPLHASPTALNVLFHASMAICDEYGLPGSEKVRLV
jgi:hypothetical protein